MLEMMIGLMTRVCIDSWEEIFHDIMGNGLLL
jgi:hypothetical protein